MFECMSLIHCCCPVRTPERNALLIRFLILALCIYCLLVFMSYALWFPTYPFFFTFSLLISCLNHLLL